MISSEFRILIDKQAQRLGCIQEVDQLSDVQAVRFLQQREGYTPCFAADEPLRGLCNGSSRESLGRRISGQFIADPDADNNIRKICYENNCCWRQPCNNSRLSPIILIDKVLSSATKTELASLVKNLLLLRPEYPETLPNNAVGLQISSLKNLSLATKKMLLAAPSTVVSESVNCSGKLHPYLLQTSTRIVPDISGRSGHFVTLCDVLFSSDILSLRKWLQDTVTFTQNGQLQYHPLIEQCEAKEWVYVGDADKVQNRPTELWRLPQIARLKTFPAPHRALMEEEVYISDPNFVPLLNLELPFLEGADFQTLARLMHDYPEELCSFRDFLMGSIEELRVASIGSTDFETNCNKAARRIREQLRKVRSDFRKSRMAAAFSLTGCFTATCALALYCIIEGKNDILKLIGPGGAVVSLSAAISSYLQKQLELKDNPAYFLWLIERQTKMTQNRT